MWTMEVMASGKWVKLTATDNTESLSQLKVTFHKLGGLYREAYKPTKETKETN